MPAPTDPATNSHMTYAPRPRMFNAPWQCWAWAALPLVSMSLLAFLPFVIAWRRDVVPPWVPGVYAFGSAIVLGFAVVKPDVNALFPIAVWALMITAIVHVLLLDRPKGQAK
ncbi:hypothetical protein ACIRL0_00560 [Streptomyces sp. NPDC102365]|uniref:hypothetical protein n=1 Tax=Streptomyces sp. NPDC102365 TaxID=3366162 RepID=UPI00382662B8